MKTVSVQLDLNLLGALLKVSRADRDRAAAERDTWIEKVASLNRGIAALERLYGQHIGTTGDKMRNGESENQPSVALSPKGRIRRGQSQALVRKFLQDGNGATITEVTRGTGTKYATAHRLIKLFAKKNMVFQSADKLWHWNATPPAAKT